MAAYAALVSLMHVIHDIKHHPNPPIYLHEQQSESLTQITASLQEFLESHTSSVSENDEADPLERRIADAAYEAEDIIESHIVSQILPAGSHYRRNSIFSFFNCFHALKKSENIPFSEAATHHDDQTNLFKDLQRAIEEMESVQKLTVEINTEKAVVHDQRPRSIDAKAAPSRTFSTTTRQKSITVCSDNVINEVMNKLTWGEPDRHVIPIVGVGGIGKTTLAKDIYEKSFIKEHFQIRAWATISQQYNTKETLCEVLCQATHREREELSEKSEDELGTELYKYLFGEKYLIVMDDLWSTEAWDKVQRYFPDNKKGSRVLVTTRLSQLGSLLNKSYSHHMKFLDEGSSWDLFAKNVFGEDSCPSELEGIGKKIVENCRGLPLSIVVVGGILKKMEYTRGCWESIGKNLTSVVNLENDKHCLRLLSLSYSHLPAYLKPCFLYMGVFEEDSEIKVSTLIKLWVCEGFLKPVNDESLEAIGKGFLKGLVDRNLVIVHAFGSTGSVKYCKIHDLLRDCCLSEGKKDGFYYVIGQDSPQGMNRQRRVVIPRNTSKKKVLHDLRSMSCVRSVISEYGKVPSSRNLRFVRAIHAYKFRYYDEESYVNSHAFQYVNLRHLAVEVNKTSSLFSSISLYWNLHSLIVSSTHNSTAPVEIWKMPQFRRIEFVEMRLFLPDPPSDAVVMENLEILREVENFKFGEGVIEKIPYMKKLQMRYSGHDGFEHEDYYCLSNIERLRKLESLHVSLWIDFRKVESLNKLTFPHSLKKLTLSMIPNFIFNDILEKVGLLPLLEKLKLWTGGFRTGKWEVAEGHFPCLKYLGIYSCSDLRKITTKDESSIIFPRLEQLHLFHLDELEEIPSEIGEISTLQKITMMGCTASMVKCAKVILEEQLELYGEEQVFTVVVSLVGENEELQTLVGPNFEVYA
ncbi:hypothetical protein OROGR_015256 [Orobanche gracilis]